MLEHLVTKKKFFLRVYHDCKLNTKKIDTMSEASVSRFNPCARIFTHGDKSYTYYINKFHHKSAFPVWVFKI